MDQSYLMNNDVSDIDPGCKEHMKPKCDINIGMECLLLLHKNNVNINDEDKDTFFEKCQEFLIAACSQLKEKCDGFSHSFIRLRYIIHPKNALDQKFHASQAPTLDEIFEAYPQFIDSSCTVKSLNEQWQSLSEANLLADIKNEKNTDQFWRKLSSYNENKALVYEDLSNFVLQILLLPNSNASSERVWSKYNLEKTKLRNRLHFETTRNLLLSSSYASFVRESSCEIEKEMLIATINVKTRSTLNRNKLAEFLKCEKDPISILDEHSYAVNLKKQCQQEESTYKKKRNLKINYLNMPVTKKYNPESHQLSEEENSFDSDSSDEESNDLSDEENLFDTNINEDISVCAIHEAMGNK
ncbi:hypothetical protein TKK_0004664 [Trichogramma kaykai]